jgi:hypothetical protein
VERTGRYRGYEGRVWATAVAGGILKGAANAYVRIPRSTPDYSASRFGLLALWSDLRRSTLGETTDLSYELKGSGLHLFFVDGRIEVK